MGRNGLASSRGVRRVPLSPTPPNGRFGCATCQSVPFTVTPPALVLRSTYCWVLRLYETVLDVEQTTMNFRLAKVCRWWSAHLLLKRYSASGLWRLRTMSTAALTSFTMHTGSTGPKSSSWTRPPVSCSL